MKRNPLFLMLSGLLPQNPTPLKELAAGRLTDWTVFGLLKLMAMHFNWRPSLKKYLLSKDGWLNFSVAITTENASVGRSISFYNGSAVVHSRTLPDADVTLIYADEAKLMGILGQAPHEVMNSMLKNRFRVECNLNKAQLFMYLVSLLMEKTHSRRIEQARLADENARDLEAPPSHLQGQDFCKKPFSCSSEPDPGVRYLDDIYLSKWSLEDFGNIKAALDEHFSSQPEICPERPLLLTQFFRQNGFERQNDGQPWHPALRAAKAFYHLMANKKPLIAANSLIAGSTTAKLPTGVIIYPDAQGGLLWGELKTVSRRLLNPYKMTPETEKLLHNDIFPFWMNRNFWEWVRTEYKEPLCQKINNRWVAYFVWKTVGISHAIPDFSIAIEKGLDFLIGEMARKKEEPGLTDDQKNTLEAMIVSLDAINAYADNLKAEAKRKAASQTDLKRKRQLNHLAKVLSRVPRQGATTLDEAVNALWLLWVGAHNENTNAGLSFGRLDQLLQPYFAMDMEKCLTKKQKEACIKHSLNLVADFMMRGTDHLPLVPDIGNYLFGGSSSDQAITLGGVTPDGKDAVCDMTYIFLKATQLLAIRDPNVNARFYPGINSDAYLTRLCSVNYATTATPSMHNDKAVLAALAKHNYPMEHARDWSATGCVEPSISGRHLAHTGSILFNLVAPLEMALNNGRHPLMRWDLGPRTGSVEKGSFLSFEDFFNAFAAQLAFLAEQAVTLNSMLAKAHAKYRATPFLSALTDGCVEKAKDLTVGGARYNSSGTANIGLADVVDSLLAIKTLVFEQKAISFERLKYALDSNFESEPGLNAMLKNKVCLFGSGDADALAMANRVAGLVRQTWAKHKNFRGGPYTTGFWSMSQHVAYGNLSGALPSGRFAGKAFTPGLTPQPHASRDFLDNIRDVAGLAPQNLDNNIAFNVKLSPGMADPAEKTIAAMSAYVKAYFEMGGMQMQFNVVDSATLRRAMAKPDEYRQLLVRISGYNAYFVTLNRQMQLELVERAEYGC
ncbi:MAG: pyruvate formate lyase family protein [Desulfatibacillaceae bacterium]|nr:pyruvate formate lyase family protein [Desulfatibacillaceae bacterium]